MAITIPALESELWLHISQGDGMHCPFDSDCHIRESGSWCPSDNLEQINLLLENKRAGLESCDFIQYGACGRLFKIVEMLANECLELGNIRYPPVPTELISIFDKQNNIEVHTLPLKTCHGAIWYIDNSWVIQVRASDTPAMKRFVLFHEAFHVLAHLKSTPVFNKRGVLRGSFNELLADHFAMSILLPERWVRQKWMEDNDFQRMVKIFDVPRPLMCIRIRRLGLA